MEQIEKASIKIMEEKLSKETISTFKVITNRVDKSFPKKSPEVSREIGAVILKKI